MYRRVLSALAAAALLTLPASAAPSHSAAAAVVMDAGSGRVLYEYNAHEPRLIASITKLMTALVAVESTPDLTAVVTVDGAWLEGAEGSSIYLAPGDQLTLETLLYGMLLESGNDAAMVVAGYCAGDVDTFVEWMNLRAADLGMADSHFENPSGLNAEGHCSSAYDMALAAQACLEHEVIARIVATKSITLEGRTFYNHNKLLSLYDGCVGMKTGYTQLAGRTLVSCAQRGEQRVIVVTLGDPNDWEDHMALLDYAFGTWPLREILPATCHHFEESTESDEITSGTPERSSIASREDPSSIALTATAPFLRSMFSVSCMRGPTVSSDRKCRDHSRLLNILS